MARNLTQAQSLCRKAHEAGAKALFLPEVISHYIPTPHVTVTDTPP